ncbi:hypothetical protein [Aeromonas allosaccharophila]|uniref:Uncharacterized protein n=1 Tax=Aeromonas allosaccharophila TaxID=656 RepID=A0AAX3NLU0_9GAMM|nr:hypothetical protein [Aeromonas allosaccharophila]WED75079.1 hypothetical protein PYU98_14085 [Aeromonas allosaccharophila]
MATPSLNPVKCREAKPYLPTIGSPVKALPADHNVMAAIGKGKRIR